MRACRRPVLVAVLLLLGSCARQVPPPDTTPPPDSAPAPVAAPASPVVAPTGPGLIVQAEPPDAELVIDGTSYGPVASLKTENGLMTLKSGIYQVFLKRAGYVSWRAEVTVGDKPETLKVSLLKK